MNFAKWFKVEEVVPSLREYEEVEELRNQINEKNDIINGYTRSVLQFLDSVLDAPRYNKMFHDFNHAYWESFTQTKREGITIDTYKIIREKFPLIADEFNKFKRKNEILTDNYDKLKCVIEEMEKKYEDKWQEAHNVTRVKELEDQVKCYKSQVEYLEDENKRLRMKI